MVDAALWVTGHTQARQVHCLFGDPHPTQGILDLSLAVSLPGGELFSLAQSFNVSRFNWRLKFIGDQETIEFREAGLYNADGGVLVETHPITDLYDQNREFIDAVREARDPAITGEDILPAMRILQQAQNLAIHDVS